MKKISHCLTDFIISTGIGQEKERAIYQYGFQIFGEAIFALSTSILLSLLLNMFWEGVWFYLFFIPLRSYLGGFHLQHYHTCFIFSCGVFGGILFLVKKTKVPLIISFIISIILLSLVIIYVITMNSDNEEIEAPHFQKKLQIIILVGVIIVLILFILNVEKYMYLTSLVLLVVIISLALEKIKFTNLF